MVVERDIDVAAYHQTVGVGQVAAGKSVAGIIDSGGISGGSIDGDVIGAGSPGADISNITRSPRMIRSAVPPVGAGIPGAAAVGTICAHAHPLGVPVVSWRDGSRGGHERGGGQDGKGGDGENLDHNFVHILLRVRQATRLRTHLIPKMSKSNVSGVVMITSITMGISLQSLMIVIFHNVVVFFPT